MNSEVEDDRDGIHPVHYPTIKRKGVGKEKGNPWETPPLNHCQMWETTYPSPLLQDAPETVAPEWYDRFNDMLNGRHGSDEMLSEEDAAVLNMHGYEPFTVWTDQIPPERNTQVTRSENAYEQLVSWMEALKSKQTERMHPKAGEALPINESTCMHVDLDLSREALIAQEFRRIGESDRGVDRDWEVLNFEAALRAEHVQLLQQVKAIEAFLPEFQSSQRHLDSAGTDHTRRETARGGCNVA